MIRKLLWRAIAYIVSRQRVRDWLIERAHRTPYSHIYGPDGSLYMWRGWLFNAFGPKQWEWLPSIRIHHIMRPDSDRHLHDHPWNARTIILRGYYTEERGGATHLRRKGYTGRLLFGEYHRISHVAVGGAWTLFITWRYRGTWGFYVNGKKVPWREYLGVTE